MGAQPACSCSSVQTQGGEENRLALLSSTLPHSRWAWSDPWHHRTLGLPSGSQAQGPRQLCQQEEEEEVRGKLVFRSWQQGAGCCEGQMWAPGQSGSVHSPNRSKVSLKLQPPTGKSRASISPPGSRSSPAEAGAQ